MSDDQIRAAISSVLYKAITELRTLADSVRETPQAGVQARSASAFYIEHGAERLIAPPQQDPSVSASHTETMVDPYESAHPAWRQWERMSSLQARFSLFKRCVIERDEAIRQRDEAWQRIAELDPCRTACQAKSRLKNEIPALKNKLRSAEDSARDYRIARDDAWGRVRKLRLIANELFHIASFASTVERSTLKERLDNV